MIARGPWPDGRTTRDREDAERLVLAQLGCEYGRGARMLRYLLASGSGFNRLLDGFYRTGSSRLDDAGDPQPPHAVGTLGVELRVHLPEMAAQQAAVERHLEAVLGPSHRHMRRRDHLRVLGEGRHRVDPEAPVDVDLQVAGVDEDGVV